MTYKIFLIIHILAGTTSLLMGPVAIFVKKGGRVHRKVGIIFFYAMLVVSATALVLGVLHNIPFLFAVGIYSAYMNTTGYRVLYQKKRGLLHQTSRFDHALSLMMLLFSAYFFFYGVYLVYDGDTFGVVFLFFAQGALRMLWQDWKLFKQRDIQPNTWLKIHIIRMVGTCVASYTAFAVVNSASRLSLVGWLLPAAIGVPIILYWLRKIKQKQPKLEAVVMA